jgi:hypothetical protein
LQKMRFFLLSALSALACVLAQQPEQFHLSLTGRPAEMLVEFVSHGAVGPNTCFYSPAPLGPPATPLPPAPQLPGYQYGAGYLVAGDDLFAAKMGLQAAGAWCTANASCAGFTFASADPACADCSVLFKSAVQFFAAAGWQTYAKPPAPAPNATSTFFEYRNATLGPVGVMHAALLTGLAPRTRYYYVCGNATGGWGPEASFVSEPETWRAAVFADFGRDNGESLVSLYAAAQEGAFDYVFHAGAGAQGGGGRATGPQRPPECPPSYPPLTTRAFFFRVRRPCLQPC